MDREKSKKHTFLGEHQSTTLDIYGYLMLVMQEEDAARIMDAHTGVSLGTIDGPGSDLYGIRSPQTANCLQLAQKMERS